MRASLVNSEILGSTETSRFILNSRIPVDSLAETIFTNVLSILDVSAAYFKVGDYNVILIDWRDAAKHILYWPAAGSVPLVAKRVALLLNFLANDAGLNPDKTKIIGHSLGGHVAGLAARFTVDEIAEVIGESRSSIARACERKQRRQVESSKRNSSVFGAETIAIIK